jgi:hypothetical protein
MNGMVLFVFDLHLFCLLVVTATWDSLVGNQLPGSTGLPVQEMKTLNMFYVEQNAGDIMWVPAGLFHAVRNMTNTVALSYNILLPDCFLNPDGPGLPHLKHPGTVFR